MGQRDERKPDLKNVFVFLNSLTEAEKSPSCTWAESLVLWDWWVESFSIVVRLFLLVAKISSDKNSHVCRSKGRTEDKSEEIPLGQWNTQDFYCKSPVKCWGFLKVGV